MNWKLKLVLAEALGIIIFFVGNLGSRILFVGIILKWVFSKKKIEVFWLFILIFCLFSILIPMLFIQRGTSWNTIQFFYYFLLIANIGTAYVFWQMIKKFPKIAQVTMIVLLCVITLPTTISTLYYHYLPYRAPSRISYGEIEALKVLKDQPNGIILTRPFDEKIREKFDLPHPLFVYESTAYVSAFTEKRTFVEDEVNLNILGVDFKDRAVAAKEFFRTYDVDFQKELLNKNKIKYIYVTKFDRFEPNENRLSLKKLFDNTEVKIFQVN
jgi:hypothetical protein